MMARLSSSLAVAAAAWDAMSGLAASAVHRTGNDGQPLPVAPQVVRVLQLYAVAEELPAAVSADCTPPPAAVVCSGGAVRRSAP